MGVLRDPRCFLFKGQPLDFIQTSIISVLLTNWYHSLYNLKALGSFTVETYVP